jgi:hypothetical protein
VYEYIEVGSPKYPYRGDLDFDLTLADGTFINLKSPNVDLLVKSSSLILTIETDAANSWPKGSAIYQNGLAREFVLNNGQLLSFSLAYRKDMIGDIIIRSKQGKPYKLPLSRQEVIDVLGRGGAFRTFLRE